MFDALSDRFEGIFSRLRSKGTLRQSDVDEVLREIRLALLEADVNFVVVKSMLERIRERAVGARIHEALNPAQQVVKLVNEALVEALGGEAIRLQYASRPPTVVLLAGLQGSGKTTNAAKLARWFRQQGRNPLLVGADLQRPAAVEQLRTLGERVGVPVFSRPGDPVATAAAGVDEARRLGRDVCIVDTAGRLAIDAEMMDQVGRISGATRPGYTFLVVDAMTGQDAVTVAESFNATLALDGVILTKLDGDARGGAALSVKEVVGKPIAFASIGEKVDDFELFHPDRLASRILGMGDMLTLIEKAEQVYEKDEAEAAAAKLLEGTFTLDDFLEQLQQVRKMGPLQNLMGMMPGVPKELRDTEVDEGQVRRIEAIIRSMTREERVDPMIIDGSRRLRIANGSGTQPSDVSQLLKQFREMRKLMKRMPGLPGKPARGPRKGRKGRKGGRVTPPGGGRAASPRQPFTLPGLNQ
ncbi:MAG TPA: signal recognition particle protein [Acidimicrobiales bacterium]|jgi:signal recognition particle subunit SRP54|nr:signal recognition particle protein [Acidimicrobiales bacterium]